MSMFSGLTNQISGWVANKTGQGQPGEEGAVDPNMQQQQQQQMPQDGVNGGEAEMVGEGGEGAAGAGGVSGLAQGLMMKAMAAKQGMQEKAGNFNTQNITNMGGSLLSNVTNLIPGRKEEEVPTPPEPNPPTDMVGGEVQYEEQVQYEQ